MIGVCGGAADGDVACFGEGICCDIFLRRYSLVVGKQVRPIHTCGGGKVARHGAGAVDADVLCVRYGWRNEIGRAGEGLDDPLVIVPAVGDAVGSGEFGGDGGVGESEGHNAAGLRMKKTVTIS